MSNKSNNIFNSKLFYEFFVFCTKKNVDFILEISEKSKIKYDNKNNKIIAVLSKNDDEFKPKIIYDVWNKIIEKHITDNNEKEKIRKDLENLFKE